MRLTTLLAPVLVLSAIVTLAVVTFLEVNSARNRSTARLSHTPSLSESVGGTDDFSAQQQQELAVGPSSIQLEAPRRLQVGDKFIDSQKYAAHAGPLAVDLNGDSKLDLLVGNLRGHFQVYLNTGTRADPYYVSKGLLKADGETVKVPTW